MAFLRENKVSELHMLPKVQRYVTNTLVEKG